MKQNFIKKMLSLVAVLFAAVVAFGQAPDLFFSEYIEGGSSNKALEIYNGTGAAVDLSNYVILQNSNGGPMDEYVDQLGGILADGDVYVIANSSAVADILNVADTTGTGICYFNGDDARALAKFDPNGTDTITFNGSDTTVTVIDFIGDFPTDPGSGWNVAGITNATVNHTLVRKSSVTGGNTNWTLSAGTDSATSEWLVYNQDDFTYIGYHIYGNVTQTLTLNVNMNYQITLGNFVAGTDFVDVAGTFNSWGGTVMSDPDNDGIYSVDITGLNIGDVVEFKFRINGTGWESVGNRTYTVVLGTNEATYWFNDNAGPQDVTFTINDGTASYVDINMKGSFDGWILHQMYDDGTNGDTLANDHVWTVVLSIPGGSWEWGAIEDDGSANGIWLIDGSNLTFSVNTDGSVTGQTNYDIPAPGTEDVTFRVNMSYQITLGNFDPLTDSVDVAGNFNGYAGSGNMTDNDSDGIYEITIGGFAAGDVAEFKFRKNADWNSAELYGQPNRTYTVVGGGDTVTYWYDNQTPPPPPGMFFSEYIEGSSNNKALEIYNGTGQDVSLDDYIIAQAINGGGWAYYHNFPVGTILAPGDVWVIAADQISTSLFDTSLADELLSYPSVVHFNGDDARALCRVSATDTTIIDIIGDPNNDPGSGWDVAGVSTATKDHTLVRKSTVVAGNTDWAASAGTTVANSEWVVLDNNTCDYLDSHPHTFYGEITFNVNMSYQVTLGNFDPLLDFVDVAGDMNGWAGGDTLLDPDGDLIYSITFSNVSAPVEWQFKFRINGSWSDLTCEFPYGGPNRVYVVTPGTATQDYWYNDLQPAPAVSIYDIQYTTDPSGDSPYLGQAVNVTGIVTAVFNNAYTIQDGTGMWSGVYVYDSGNNPARGDSVNFTATVQEYYNLTELTDVLAFTIINSGNPLPAPSVISTLAASSEEGWESVLVRVENASCTAAPNTYGEWYVDDTSGACQVDDPMYSYSPTVGNVYNITGVIGYSFSSYELLPRDSADIEDITVTVDVQTVSIVAGWSIFSTYIDLDQPLCDSVFADIVSDVILVKNGNGLVYWPAFGLNAIGNLVLGEGYQINLVTAHNVDFVGTAAVPESTLVSIPAGWSIIGYLRTTPANIETLFSSFTSDIILVKNGNGLVYWPAFGLNAIGNMNPGEGYQINLVVAHDYYYPANGPMNTAKSSVPVPVNLQSKLNTGNNMTIAIPAEAWNELPVIGNEIGVYNQNNELAGSAVYTGKNLAITVWGDDMLTPAAEGMQPGDELNLYISDAQMNLKKLVIESWTGDAAYKSNGIAIAESIRFEGNSLELYPNPAQNLLNLNVEMPAEGFVKIDIYNALGVLVQQVYTGQLSGAASLQADVSALPAGNYFVRFITNDQIQTQGIKIVR